MNSEREQIINFLLQQCDVKNRVIEEMQRQLADLRKESEQKKPKKSAPESQ